MNMPLETLNHEIIDAVLYRGYFNNKYWELITYFMYQKQIDFRRAFQTSLRKDLETLEILKETEIQLVNKKSIRKNRRK